jgi:hypothetical protein
MKGSLDKMIDPLSIWRGFRSVLLLSVGLIRQRYVKVPPNDGCLFLRLALVFMPCYALLNRFSNGWFVIITALSSSSPDVLYRSVEDMLRCPAKI